jgi:hypothetical protein
MAVRCGRLHLDDREPASRVRGSPAGAARTREVFGFRFGLTAAVETTIGDQVGQQHRRIRALRHSLRSQAPHSSSAHRRAVHW